MLDGILNFANDIDINYIYFRYGDDHGRLTNDLSRYAWKNKNRRPIREFIAEAWSEYKSNPNCRPLAKEVGDLIMLKLKKWREQ